MMTEEAYLRMMDSPWRIDPNNPEQVRKMREMVERASGGKRTIRTTKEMEGKGSRAALSNYGGFGYTITDSEEEKRAMSDPNSAEYKRRRERERQASREQQDKIKMQMKGYRA